MDTEEPIASEDLPEGFSEVLPEEEEHIVDEPVVDDSLPQEEEVEPVDEADDMEMLMMNLIYEDQ